MGCLDAARVESTRGSKMCRLGSAPRLDRIICLLIAFGLLAITNVQLCTETCFGNDSRVSIWGGTVK